jgi:hypothetical protein
MYKEWMELQLESFDKTISELKNAFREQGIKVEEQRKVLTTISRTGPMIYQERDSKSSRTEATRMQNADFETEPLAGANEARCLGREIGRKLGFNSVVIHNDPVISNGPVSPNVTLSILCLARLGGLLIGSPFLTPPYWFLHRRNPVIAEVEINPAQLLN